ncbi:hypothetical protein DV711_09660 [Motiliproteus coralliicola]|uniref:DNA repair protein n=1 Tax=Motiliproteus coralliicola TaxID=2283196 RepID=A0A369WMB8_9GAMM|nr:hypothetical protein [Motiliproteus coralliicola]RDE22827.1 hypothetical protein DV711_09660 [Motiliproteus coralliicola]
MSPATIVTLIIVGIVVMVGAAFVAQSMENARKARALKIKVINERIRRISSMLSDIPHNYMTADLRQFMLTLLKRNCHEILELDPRHSSAGALSKKIDELQKQEFKSALDTLKPPFSDPISGQGLRARIKDLVNTIVAMSKEGSLDKAAAVKYSNQGKMMFELISVDIALISARNAEQNKKTKVAAVHYSNCLKKLKRINTKNLFNKRIQHLTNKLKQLKQQIAEAEAAAKPQTSEQDEWSKFEEQQNDWKIKQDYE